MGLMSSLANIFSRTKAASAPTALAEPAAAIAVSARYAQRGSADLLKLYKTNDELRKVCWKVADAVGSVRWRVKRNGKELPDHEFAKLLRAPNSEMSGPAHRALVTLYLDLVGENFDLLLASERRGYRWDVCPVPPPDVQLTSAGITVRIGGRHVEVPRGLYVWSKHHDPVDPYGRGIGPALALADEILTAEAASKWTAAFFRNGARPDLVMSMPGASPEVVQAARAAWNNRYQGEQLAHQVAFLGGDWKVHEMAVKVKDLALIEVRAQAADAIREMYGVPPELFGQLDSSNRATATTARQLFAEFVLLPRLEMLKRDWEAKLLPALGYGDIELEYDSPLPDDVEGRRALMKAHPEAFTLNEVRREAGLSARQGADVYLRRPGFAEVSAGPIEDMTDQARALPPPVPSRPVLRLLKGVDLTLALELALGQLDNATPAQTALALARWRGAVDAGASPLTAAEQELARAAGELKNTDYSSALAALREAA